MIKLTSKQTAAKYLWKGKYMTYAELKIRYRAKQVVSNHKHQ